jgi:hypothetical protein
MYIYIPKLIELELEGSSSTKIDKLELEQGSNPIELSSSNISRLVSSSSLASK